MLVSPSSLAPVGTATSDCANSKRQRAKTRSAIERVWRAETAKQYTASAIPNNSGSDSRRRFRGPEALSACNHCDERGASLPINRDLNLVVEIGRVSRGRIGRMSGSLGLPRFRGEVRTWD